MKKAARVQACTIVLRQQCWRKYSRLSTTCHSKRKIKGYLKNCRKRHARLRENSKMIENRSNQIMDNTILIPRILHGNILSIKWNFVRGSWWWWWSFFMYLQSCSTVQFCCTCAVNKYTRRTTGTRWDTHHGHYKGTHSRAFQGRALRC